MDDLLGEFLAETSENLEIIDTELVRFEANPQDEETLNNIFRLVHTVKGTAGFLDLPRLEAVAHAGETLLGRFRDGTLKVSSEAVTLVLECVDCIRCIRTQLENSGQEPNDDNAELIARLESMAQGDAAPSSGEAVEPEPEPEPELEPELEPERELADPIKPKNKGKKSGKRGRKNRHKKIKAFKNVPADPPGGAQPVPPASEIPPPAQIKPEPDIPTSGAAIGAATNSAPPRTHTIRVNVDILEQLMTRVSELVLIRNQLLQMLRNSDESEFKMPLQRLSGITAELQETVMKTRMQPIGSVWSKLPRIVRDASRELGKSIELELEGEQTELDRQVLEQIKDPLTHMIRNSCDHGIEPIEQRVKNGKCAGGTIRLNAWHEGGHILIQISDDGGGLDAQRIRTTAQKRGIADEAGLAAMNDAQLYRLIFAPGFSTASKVTNLSGRGVGMDVVKTNIELMGGSVDLTSEPGRGTCFTIKIPLTMTIISALIIGTGGERLALPQLSVLELVRIGSGEDCRVERINRASVLRLRDHLLPVVPLAELLGMSVDSEEKETALDKGFVVIMQVGPRRFGLMVEEVFDTEEIVVKPLAEMLGARSEYSGATILGDGKVILILDPNGLARAGASLEDEAGIFDMNQDQDKTSPKAENTDILLFRSGKGTPRACPLGLVTRLEALDVKCIAHSRSGLVAQYRGHLMPLVGVSDMNAIAGEQSVPVVVFGHGERAVGLVVDEILDIIEEPLNIELESVQSGLLGTAVLKGEATEIIDVGWYLEQARPGWANESETPDNHALAKKILLIEAHPFFRALLHPLLSAAGYEVTIADNLDEARALFESDTKFDAVLADMDKEDYLDVLSDIERECKAPILRLSGQNASAEPYDAVSRTDRDTLLSRLNTLISTYADAA